MKKLLAIVIVALFVAPMAMGANHVVNMTGNTYVPGTLTVTQGDSVTWTNSDAVTHTVTDTSGAFNSGNILAGGSWGKRFTVIGQYGYKCNFHPAMVGTLIVTPVYTIPSMTTYGLALLALLLIASTVLVLRRKRAGAVA